MGRARNAVVARNSPASCPSAAAHTSDGSIKSIGELNRTLFIMLQFGDDSSYRLVQLLPLTQGFW